MKWDLRDCIILAHVNAAGISATFFIWMHPDPTNFASWCGLIATLVGCYHWFVLKDSKEPDAGV